MTRRPPPARALLGAILLLSACALPRRPAAPAPRDELGAAEAALAEAIGEGDTATLDALLAPGFALVGEDTTRRVERATWISNTRRFTFDSVRAEISSTSVRGDTAEVALRLRFQIRGPELPPARVLYDLQDHWVRTDRSWKLTRRRLLARQINPL
jgi:hypothetical protein